MSIWRHAALAATVAALPILGFGGTAQAQQATTATPSTQVLSDPAAIADCLCMHQRLEWRGVEMSVAGQKVETERGAIAELQQRTEDTRSRLAAAVTQAGGDSELEEELRALMRRADEARLRYNNETVPQYNRIVDGYNDMAQRYGTTCGGRAFAGQVLASVQANLNCPRE